MSFWTWATLYFVAPFLVLAALLSNRRYAAMPNEGAERLGATSRKVILAVGVGGTPIRLGDVATVRFGPEIRRGAADWNGTGEAVGGIVVMRIGSNALEVIKAVKQEIAALRLPDGVELIPTYDRSELILGSIATLMTGSGKRIASRMIGSSGSLSVSPVRVSRRPIAAAMSPA